LLREKSFEREAERIPSRRLCNLRHEITFLTTGGLAFRSCEGSTARQGATKKAPRAGCRYRLRLNLTIWNAAGYCAQVEPGTLMVSPRCTLA
jgi:hypothetical protein